MLADKQAKWEAEEQKRAQISTQQKPKAAPGPPIDWLKNEAEIKNALAAGTDYSDLGGSPFVPEVPSYFSSPPPIGLPAADTNKMSIYGLGGY